MEVFERNGWRIEFDAATTRGAYDRVTERHVCMCAACRNYRGVRDEEFPAAVLNLLRTFGIDPHKEAEVFDGGPGKHERTHLYSGWYHFIGKIVGAGDAIDVAATTQQGAAWEIRFSDNTDMALETLEGLPLVQIEFYTELPWVLEEKM